MLGGKVREVVAQAEQRKGLGKLAAPIASRDVRNRWATSLERLKAAVEAGD